MSWFLILMFLDGSLLVICLLVACWKYLMAVAVIVVGLLLAGRIQERLERRRQRPKS